MDAFEKKFNDIVSGKESADEGIRSALATKLTAKWDEWRKLRAPYEEKWLQALRQHKGIYDPEILDKIDDNSSKVYPKVTRAKDNMALSRLHEMLFPDLDRNWTIEPTPVPRVSKEVALMLKAQYTTIDQQTGQVIPPTQAQLDKAIEDYAKATAKNCQLEMDDQLLEMGYSMKIAKPTLKSSLIFGHGVCKGPLHETKTAVVWQDTGTDLNPVEKKVKSPRYIHVPVWDWYPDLTVVHPEDMQGAFERHAMSKHDLRNLGKMPEFNKAKINEYLKNHPDGNFTPENWEIKLRDLEAGVTGKNVFDSSETAAQGIIGDKKYVAYEYWGYIDTTDLLESGASLTDDEKNEIDGELYANIWILDNDIIRAVVVDPPGGEIYKVTYWDKDDSSLLGEGLPHTIRHSQLTISAAARMLLNNAAICSGPQFEINFELVSNEDINNIFPMKVWLREGKGIDAQYDAVRVKHVDSHMDEYLKIIDTFKGFGDEESCLPTWIISQPMTSEETAHGLSMRMGAITMSIKDLVRNFDDFTEKIIGSLYEWNQRYSEKEEIKGDFKIKARGSSSLVMKEVRMQGLNQFATTLTPEDWAYVPRRGFLEERVKANDLPINLRTEEEADQYLQKITDQRAKELQYATLEAQIKKDNSMALFSLVKAKEKQREIQSLDEQGILNEAAEGAEEGVEAMSGRGMGTQGGVVGQES